MQVIAMTILKSLITEALMKRLVYIAIRALAKSTKNKLDDDAAHAVGIALGLEEEK